MALHHWFIPHKDTHKKAHLISWEGLIIYILLFILLQVGFSITSYTKPGILGITSSIDQDKLIELTNSEREKQGLPKVLENEALNKAAELKAENMFAENYWAHFAPSGKTPWDFILSSGYRFTFAGENLAKNFYTSEEVVEAWMNSPTHRDNLLNSNYRDVGIAVVEGVLNGQKTTLIVQEFGTTEMIAKRPAVKVEGQEVTVPERDLNDDKPRLITSGPQVLPTTKTLVDPYQFSKLTGFSIIGLMVVLLALDIIILRKRGVFRFSSHHVAHMALLSVAAGSLFLAGPGNVL